MTFSMALAELESPGKGMIANTGLVALKLEVC